MATLKEVQTKISAVKKTKQITKAMNMVATSRLRNAQQTMDAFRPYAGKFSEVLGNLAKSASEDISPLLVPREQVKKVHIVLCTSDRGLCGGFNTNLIHKAEALIQEKTAPEVELSLTCFGKKGAAWCKKNKLTVLDKHIGVVGSKFGYSIALTSGQKLIYQFLTNQFDEVYVVYAEFVSMARQLPRISQLLPIPPLTLVEEETVEDTDAPYRPEHICEPSPGELLGELLPKNVYVQLYSALLETSTCEHAARMTAMDNATKACNDMLESLSLIYNKARQASITADLMDIVGGAEALKG